MTAITGLARTAPLASSAPRSRRRSRAAWWNAGATAAIWATNLFVVALWVAGGGIEALAGWDAEAVTTLGRLTGLVASNLMLLQVLAMARIPLFERGLGRDAITRLHRLTGFWSFWLMLAHIVLIVVGYAMPVGENVFVQLWTLVVDYPGMLLATAATGLLIMVVATSIRRARRTFRYESWHLLHLYAYVGVFLALPHQLWTGADFLSSTAATVYWWTLWAAAAAAVLWFRIAVPLLRSRRHALVVSAIEPDGARGVRVRMRGRGLDRLDVRAGQFFVWRFLDGAGWSRGNPYSLAQAPDGRELVVSARIVGDGTRRLTGLRTGTRVLFEGAYGTLTADRRSGRKMLMIAAGAGVAPLVSLLQEDGGPAGDATLVVRESSDADAMCTEAISDLVRAGGLRHYRLVGPRASGGAWLPASHGAWKGADLIRYLAPDLEAYDVFVCGPGPWMKAVEHDLRTAGVARDRIHSESFTI